LAFNHTTIGAVVSPSVTNNHFPLENVTLTSVGLSVTRQAFVFPTLSFTLGLTPPGDEGIEIYTVLASGLLAPSDGISWVGSIRIRTPLFIVLNYITRQNVIVILTWSTSS
jgi:hypothetical protein